LRTLEHLGIFQNSLSAPPEELARLVDYRDESQDLNQRARSYLHANCSHCHRKWGGGNADFQLLYLLELADMGIVQTRPGHGTFSLSDAMIVAPSAPHQSVLPYRMATIGPGRMPRIGSNVVDQRGLSLVLRWIEQIEGDAKKTDQGSHGAVGTDAAIILDHLGRTDDVSSDNRGNIDRLLASTSGAMQLLRAVDEDRLAGPLAAEVIQRGVQSPHATVRDLFERFIPEEHRTKRLGSVIDPNAILALPGDVAEGKRVYFEVEGVQCKTCHRIDSRGGNVGPDLSEIGKKYNRAQLLETILQPSKEIDPKYVAYLVETTQGQIHSGLVVAKTDSEIVLIDAQANSIRVPASNVERLVTQSVSLMPELLLRDMTARQVADLTEYLSSLK
jgi:putative heme-binding domain-containing protein